MGGHSQTQHDVVKQRTERQWIAEHNEVAVCRDRAIKVATVGMHKRAEIESIGHEVQDAGNATIKLETVTNSHKRSWAVRDGKAQVPVNGAGSNDRKP